MIWDESLFANVAIQAGNPLNTEDEIGKVVFVGKTDADMSKSIQKLYKERYPELKRLEGDIFRDVLQRQKTEHSFYKDYN